MKRMITVLLIFCLVSIQAFGNAASPYEDPESNLLLFDGDTGILLREEWVKFSIDENRWDSKVEVVYDIENVDREDSRLDIMFIAPYFNYQTGEVQTDSFKVIVDGIEIREFQVKKADDIPVNWNASYDMEIIDPVDNRVLDRRLGYDGGPYGKAGDVKGIQFTIDIEKGQSKTLEMTYDARIGYYSFGDVVNDVNTHLYYLTPATFWDGNPFVNLEIEFPNGGYEVHSSIELEKVSSTNYKTRLTELPDEEWTFCYVDTSGLFYGTNTRKIHNGVTFGIIIFTAAMGIFLRRRNKVLGRIMMMGIIGELFLFRPTYGTMFMFYIFGPAIGLPILLFLIIRIVRKYWNKRQEHRL